MYYAYGSVRATPTIIIEPTDSMIETLAEIHARIIKDIH